MYIRTKDGIHSVEAVPLSNGRIRYSLSNEDSLISKEDFEKITIREAKTIEELCDEFVIALKDSKKNPNDNIYDKEEYYSIFQHIGYAKNYYNEDYNDLYGAIWTDKGLIYVAKMDSEGKLVLI